MIRLGGVLDPAAVPMAELKLVYAVTDETDRVLSLWHNYNDALAEVARRSSWAEVVTWPVLYARPEV